MRRPTVLTLLLVVLVLAAPAAAAATTTYSDTISGYEYAFSSTEGRFAGTASGALPGTWIADVVHTPLCLSCGTTATITGGSVSLATVVNYVPVVLTGTFTSGTVQVANPGTGCTNQTFAVNGALSNVSGWTGISGAGLFSATLTHYRHAVFGYCLTYAASVRGSLSLSF